MGDQKFHRKATVLEIDEFLLVPYRAGNHHLPTQPFKEGAPERKEKIKHQRSGNAYAALLFHSNISTKASRSVWMRPSISCSSKMIVRIGMFRSFPTFVKIPEAVVSGMQAKGIRWTIPSYPSSDLTMASPMEILHSAPTS